MFYSVKSAVSKLWAVDLRGLEFFQGEYEIIGRAEIICGSSQRVWPFLAALLYSDILCCYYSDKYNVN